jgi:hypothetical protein
MGIAPLAATRVQRSPLANDRELTGRGASARWKGLPLEQRANFDVRVTMMSRAEIYERNAAECERECARATTLVLKRKYRDLAQQWRDMAEQADRAVVKRTQRPERKNASP